MFVQLGAELEELFLRLVDVLVIEGGEVAVEGVAECFEGNDDMGGGEIDVRLLVVEEGVGFQLVKEGRQSGLDQLGLEAAFGDSLLESGLVATEAPENILEDGGFGCVVLHLG